GTAVSFHYNKGILESQNISKVKNLIAHDYIYSSTAIGPILLAANSGNKFSKEFIVDVKAGLPVDFTLSRKLNHSYADGNQLATFSTSILKDSYGNTVSDGTLVVFYITTSSGVILQTTGTTIKGIATASMIHPEKADSWSVTAAVTGMASSNTINLEFQQVFDDYEIQLLEGNRSIIVGPLKSFMGQIIPDGVTVELKIVGQAIEETYLKQSYNGKVRFELNPDLIPKGNYDLNFTAGGITKTFKKVSFE
ncbi:Ig-like domain-containing protein, partial [Nonlabens mediterrranea]|nr:Ig-like domain-containing protein [Nonlabens mediterrranea]